MTTARLEIEGIRCFVKKQSGILRPLTLLVGENSSGKSTFLAVRQIAGALVRGAFGEVNFNTPPFRLGAFAQIAAFNGPKIPQAKSFSLKLLIESEQTISVCGSFEARFGQAWLRDWSVRVGELRFGITFDPRGGHLATQWQVGKASVGSRELQDPWSSSPPWGVSVDYFVHQSADISDNLRQKVLNGLRVATSACGTDAFAFAPIRTSPERTYDPISVEPQPEGSHIPMLLAQLASSRKGSWARLKPKLAQFGRRTGLFKDIDVIRKGAKESDPFQIGVTSGERTHNLVDVGYGVSQVLPILVDTLQHTENDAVFLLQQPEVHLHPRAQAELGTFFAGQARSRRRFVIETHSDYLIDRVRLEVRRRRLKPTDVSLVYFERKENGAVIHNLELNEVGSIMNPPPGYRQFFLDEERRILEI